MKSSRTVITHWPGFRGGSKLRSDGELVQFPCNPTHTNQIFLQPGDAFPANAAAASYGKAQLRVGSEQGRCTMPKARPTWRDRFNRYQQLHCRVQLQITALHLRCGASYPDALRVFVLIIRNDSDHARVHDGSLRKSFRVCHIQMLCDDDMVHSLPHSLLELRRI